MCIARCCVSLDALSCLKLCVTVVVFVGVWFSLLCFSGSVLSFVVYCLLFVDVCNVLCVVCCSVSTVVSYVFLVVCRLFTLSLVIDGLHVLFVVWLVFVV